MVDSQILLKEMIFPIKLSLEFDCAKFALGFSVGINTILVKKLKTMNGKKIDFYWQNNGIIESQKATFSWLKHSL